MDYEQQVGFYTSGEWRFGPLWVYLPIAAYAASTGKPFTIEEVGTGRILAGFDGNAETGDSQDVKEKIFECYNCLQDEMSIIYGLLEYKKEFLEFLANKNKGAN